MTSRLSIDDAPFGAFHRRLVIYSCGGPFCDGYILGIIAIALGPLSDEIGLSPEGQGLIAAASLVGMFIGGSLFGYVTDRLGRRVMYSVDLFILVVASGAQFWVHGFWSLFVLRLILGMAIGADYPIATALLTEFAPKRQRGMLLGTMIGAWWLGYAVSFIAGFSLSGHGQPSWRWMLASSALPAAIVSLLRLGTPESPRWLAANGRINEARALVRKHLGADYELIEPLPTHTDYRAIFRAPYGGRTAFVCLFWSCQVIPTFGIDTFVPELLKAFGSPDPSLGAAVLSLFFLAGVIPAIVVVDRVGRRPVLTMSFAVTGITLVLLAFVPKTASLGITFCFIVFAVFNAGGSVLQWIYPSELFPTEVRATALGFATSISRIGAAAGTYLFPIGLLQMGTGNLMLIVGGICLIGWVAAVFSAPETRGLTLNESSGSVKTEVQLKV